MRLKLFGGVDPPTIACLKFEWVFDHKSTKMASQNMVDTWRGFFGHGESIFDGPRGPKIVNILGF